MKQTLTHITHHCKAIAIAVLAACSLPLAAQNNVIDEVIWVVGDDAILLSDVEEARITAELQRNPIEDPYCTIPEQMAIQKLFLHQAALDSVEVNEASIIRQVDEEVNAYLQHFGSRENIERITRKPMSQWREQLKKVAREKQMVQEVQAKLVGNVKVTPAEVREYFKDIPQDSLPFIPQQVEVQIVTRTPEPTRKEVERIEGKLREYARRVNSGEADFSTLARLYSQDGSARNGGELDYSGRNQWVPEFANVAFSLNDPKKVSKIVRTEFGFHIIQYIDKRGDRVKVRHILLKPEIEDSIYTDNLARLDSIASDIREGKFTFEEAAQILSDDKDTRNNKGIMSMMDEQSGELSSRIMMKQLPTEVAREVEKLQPGEISPAFIYTNEKGQSVCAVIKLKNRIEGHYASMTEDYQRLKDVVLEKRREEKLRQWIADKQKSTYVRINPEWRNCKFEYPGWMK